MSDPNADFKTLLDLTGVSKSEALSTRMIAGKGIGLKSMPSA